MPRGTAITPAQAGRRRGGGLGASSAGLAAARARLLAALLILMGVGVAPPSLAVSPQVAPTQYVRVRWGTDRGFPGGTVYAITQSADGYLWIGAESGLVRFDGVNFTLVATQDPSPAPLGPVIGLTADGDGSLWVRILGPRVLRYRGGACTSVSPDLGWPNPGVSAAAPTHDGGIVVAAAGGGVLRSREGRASTVIPTGAMPRSPVISIAESADGTVWLGTRDAGLFRVQGGKSEPVHGSEGLKINCLLGADGGDLWLGTDTGLVRWDGSQLTRAGLPPSLEGVQALDMTRDRDGNLWIGTSANGLLRLNARGLTGLDDGSPGLHRPVTA